jgi:hypothetical protein
MGNLGGTVRSIGRRAVETEHLLLLNVILRRKPQSTFCVDVRLWLYSDMHILVPAFWTDPEDFMNRYIGAIWNFSKGTGLL